MSNYEYLIEMKSYTEVEKGALNKDHIELFHKMSLDSKTDFYHFYIFTNLT